MKLYEHPDFEQAILRAAEHFRGRGLRPAVIEKDYYVTEALRIISVTAGDKVIFKGGTSLSKGWNLIQRFSEDIDIFLDPLAFKPAWERTALIVNSRNSVMLSENTRLLRLSRKRARPLADSVATTASPMRSVLVGRVKSPVASFSKLGRQVAANLQALLTCVPILVSSWRKPAPHSAQRMREDSHCGCCTSGGHSSRRCLPSTRRWNCSSATGNRLEHTQGTITICSNWQGRTK